MSSFRFNSIFLLIFYWCSLGGGTGLNRTIRQAGCSENQFKCSRGNCIEKLAVCNGLENCVDGSDESPTACQCGRGAAVGSLSGKPPGSHQALAGSQPWHAGIYRVRHNNHYTLICSGALIFEDIILTTANCVIDPDSHLTYSTASLRVSVGKQKKDYNVDEPFQQKREIREIIKMDRYDGDTKGYAKNLAIVKLKNPVKRSDFAGPACLWSLQVFPSGEKKGTDIFQISGWGLQLGGGYTVNLRETLIDLMDIGSCVLRFYDPLYKRFLTNDKFCFTYSSGVALRDEDTGAPVTVIHNGIVYLIGIASVQLPNADFGIATKLTRHMGWIKKTVHDLKEADNCLLGSHFNCNSDSKCIPMAKVCNSVNDCKDGSDEEYSLCASIPQQGGSSCQIPDGREIFHLLKCGDTSGCKSKYEAPSSSKYQITCPDGRGFAKLGVKAEQVVCSDREWIPALSEIKCLKLCPPQESKSLDMTCEYRGSRVKCSEPMRPDTIIKLSCRREFKKQLLVRYAERTKCLSDGSLEHDISAECTPICGVLFNINEAQHLISDGTKVKYAKYPWHAGLYWKTIEEDEQVISYKCGGTLIDTNKVLTAGHCVWDGGKNNLMNPTNLLVGLGKYYSNWARFEPLSIKVEVRKIIPGRHYSGANTKHSQDIAVLILSKDVELSNHIMPACLDLNSTVGGIPRNGLGHIVGWGRLEETDLDPSAELMETWMKYLDLDTCRNKYKKYDFSEYLQSDKFCVEYNNGSGTQMGDSGGGLTFIHEELHYVYGVVSVKKRGQNEFAAFTNVLSHAAWLQDIINGY